MAPKVMKTTNAVKHTQMKKPSSSTNGLIDKASKAEAEGTALTELALSKLQDASDDKVEGFLGQLGAKQQQGLWKRFERNRAEENDDGFRSATAGVGRNRNARSLLKVWLQSGMTTRNSLYQDASLQIQSKREKGETEVWQPLHYMLTHKYGPKELKARVLSGSIAIRANPKDPRFPEFCEVTEYTQRSVAKTGTLNMKTKTQSINWSDFDQLQKLELDKSQEVLFCDGPSPEQTNPLALTGWASARGGNISPSTSPPGSASARQSDLGASMCSVSSAILASIANSETLASKKTPKEARMALVKCKGAVNSLINSLEEQSLEVEGKTKATTTKAIGELMVVKKLLDKEKVADLKPGPLQKLVTKAASLAKKHSKILED